MKIAHAKERDNLHLPKKIIEVFKEVTDVLDSTYGVHQI